VINRFILLPVATVDAPASFRGRRPATRERVRRSFCHGGCARVDSADRSDNGIIGVGYRFGWGDLLFACRNLAYIPNGEPRLDEFRMGGFLLGATFRW
jgi:hypothetical protein